MKVKVIKKLIFPLSSIEDAVEIISFITEKIEVLELHRAISKPNGKESRSVRFYYGNEYDYSISISLYGYYKTWGCMIAFDKLYPMDLYPEIDGYSWTDIGIESFLLEAPDEAVETILFNLDLFEEFVEY